MRDDYRNQSGYFSPTENAVVHGWESSNGFNLEEDEKRPKKFDAKAYLEKAQQFTDGQIVSEQIALKEITTRLGGWIARTTPTQRMREASKYADVIKQVSVAKSKLRILHELKLARDKQNANKRKNIRIREYGRKLFELMPKDEYRSFVASVSQIVEEECGKSLQQRFDEEIANGR